MPSAVRGPGQRGLAMGGKSSSKQKVGPVRLKADWPDL
jgi:hypothetical protein